MISILKKEATKQLLGWNGPAEIGDVIFDLLWDGAYLGRRRLAHVPTVRYLSSSCHFYTLFGLYRAICLNMGNMCKFCMIEEK
jgi:hypothetical protein